MLLLSRSASVPKRSTRPDLLPLQLVRLPLHSFSTEPKAHHALPALPTPTPQPEPCTNPESRAVLPTGNLSRAAQRNIRFRPVALPAPRFPVRPQKTQQAAGLRHKTESPTADPKPRS